MTQSKLEAHALRSLSIVILLAHVLGCGGGDPAAAIDAGADDAGEPPAPPEFGFQQATTAAGISHLHYFVPVDDLEEEYLMQSGGIAIGDYDGDGWVDVYAVGGAAAPDHLYRNRGDGTFEDATADSGIDTTGENTNGAIFADYDGDGALDLIVGLLFDNRMLHLYRNQGDGSFVDESMAAGFVGVGQPLNWSTALGDYDGDDDLDLFVTHWQHYTVPTSPPTTHLWRNEGNGTFTNASIAAGLASVFGGANLDYTFTPTFSDIDDDGHLDLLLAADFGRAKVLRNDGDATFTDITNGAISVLNGMASAVADFDRDGHLDWFVDSITWEGTEQGNALYLGNGDGTFWDRGLEAGVLDGGWAYGACAQDFDHDGFVDIFHTSGFVGPNPIDPVFENEPDRLFMANGDGTFREVAEAMGVANRGSGRAVACVDYDDDGDIDIFVGNERAELELYRNELGAGHHFLRVSLRGPSPNTRAIGARVEALVGGVTQTREIHAGGAYLSQEPTYAHFGLGLAERVDELKVRWPDGTLTQITDVDVDQRLELVHPSLSP